MPISEREGVARPVAHEQYRKRTSAGIAMNDPTKPQRFSRERCGMALAIAAVACLSSVIVQWSTHFPEEDAVLEQTLFGDLVDEQSSTTSERLPLRQTALLPDLQPLPASDAFDANRHGVAEPKVESASVANDEAASIVPTVRFTEPVVAEPTLIHPASFSDSGARNVSRLSGVIEDVAPAIAPSTTTRPGNVVQLGTITFED